MNNAPVAQEIEHSTSNRTVAGAIPAGGTFNCCKCGESIDKPYVVKNGRRKGKVQSYCRKCNAEDVKERKRAFKAKMVVYKGGKCQCCGYNKTQDAMDFHHVDPSEKDFTVGGLQITSYDKNREKIERELDKCILVCKNCHAEIHAGVRKLFPR